jgi:hypothetical protein
MGMGIDPIDKKVGISIKVYEIALFLHKSLV